MVVNIYISTAYKLFKQSLPQNLGANKRSLFGNKCGSFIFLIFLT